MQIQADVNLYPQNTSNNESSILLLTNETQPFDSLPVESNFIENIEECIQSSPVLSLQDSHVDFTLECHKDKYENFNEFQHLSIKQDVAVTNSNMPSPHQNTQQGNFL